MNISKFINENESPYDSSLERKIGNVEKLVEKNIISSRLGKVLMNFLIRKDVNETIKHNIVHILQAHKNKKDRWLFVNFSKRKTSYT